MGTTDKEDQWRRKCHIDCQRRQIKNGKECYFRPLGNQTRKAYIMIGVPSCVTEELLQQGKEVLEASRMTTWNSEKQKSEPTNMVNVYW